MHPKNPLAGFEIYQASLIIQGKLKELGGEIDFERIRPDSGSLHLIIFCSV